MTSQDLQRQYVQGLLGEEETVLASVPVRRKRDLWTHIGRFLLAILSGGVVVMNKDFADMVLTEKRILLIPALVVFEAPLVPAVRTEPPEIIPREDVLDARFRRRWLSARYLWGDTLILRTRQGKLAFSIDRDDTVWAQDLVRLLKGSAGD